MTDYLLMKNNIHGNIMHKTSYIG